MKINKIKWSGMKWKRTWKVKRITKEVKICENNIKWAISVKNKEICYGTVNKLINGVKMWVNKVISKVISKRNYNIKVKMIINMWMLRNCIKKVMIMKWIKRC